MQIVIEIPDDFKDYIEDILMGVGDDKIEMLVDAVMEGTPLPKGHGDLLGRQHLLSEIALLKKSPWYNEDTAYAKLVKKEAVEIVEDLCVKQEPTIIPAEEVKNETI